MSLTQWDLPPIVIESYKKLGLQQLFQWQVDCLNLPGVLDGKNLVYSAPTGAGKSLIAEIILLKKFLKTKKKVLYILPFISLAREKMFSMRSVFEIIGLQIDGYIGGLSPSGGFSSVDVAICTIEKANALINRLIDENEINNLGMVIVDEIHMIGDINRGYLIELLLTKIKYMNEIKSHSSKKSEKLNISLVGMSATIPNLDLLAMWLNAESYQTDFRPVPLINYMKVGTELFDKECNKIKNFYTDPNLKDDEDGIANLCLETLKTNHSVLIFCPTKNWCENLALSLAKSLFQFSRANSDSIYFKTDTGDFDDVIEQLRRSPAGLDAVLKKTIPFAVAYHHAGLTTEERDIVETGFRNNIIRVLVATSTLSSGVNLPARRVIIRTPSFNRGLLDVRSYHQMAGRAGRKGIDDKGESILICKQHERNKGKKLLTSSLPPVKSCLVLDPNSPSDVTSAIRRAILEVIVNGIASSNEQVKSYVKCTLLSAQLTFNERLVGRSNRTKSTTNEDSNIDQLIRSCIDWLQDHEFIYLQDRERTNSFIGPTKLGRAALMSSLPTSEALRVLSDLQVASKAFALDSELHLVYQITPIYALSSNLNWFNFLTLYESLPPAHRRVADLVGVDEGFLTRLASSGGLKSTHRLSEMRERQLNIHTRFYAALILHDLVQELPLGVVCEKYVEHRGMIQSLQQSAATFAGMVTAFCRQLAWWSIEVLLREFQSRLVFGVQRELLDLMQISLLNSVRARALYEAGLTTCQTLAGSEPTDVEVLLRNANKFTSKRDAKEVHHPLSSLRGIRVFGSDKSLTEKEAAVWIVNEAKALCGVHSESLTNDSSRAKFRLVSSDHLQTTPSDDQSDGIEEGKPVAESVLKSCSLPSQRDAANRHLESFENSPRHGNACSGDQQGSKVDYAESAKPSNDGTMETHRNTSITESQLAAFLEEDFGTLNARSLPIKADLSTNPASSTPVSREVRTKSDSFTLSDLSRDKERANSVCEEMANHDSSSCSLNEFFSSSNDFSGDMFDASSSDHKKLETAATSCAAGSDVNWSTESVFQCQTAQDLFPNERNNVVSDGSTTASCPSELPFSNYIQLNQEARTESVLSVESQMSKLSISNCQSNDSDSGSDIDTDPFITDCLSEHKAANKKKTLNIVNLSSNILIKQFLKKWKDQSKFSMAIYLKDHDKNSESDKEPVSLISFACCWSDSVYFIDEMNPVDSNYKTGFISQIREILLRFSSKTVVVSWNAKQTIKFLLKHLKCDLHHLQWIDPKTALWLLDPDHPCNNDVLNFFEKYSPDHFKIYEESCRSGNLLASTSRRERLDFCVYVLSSFHVMNALEKKLREESLWKSFVNVEMPHELRMALMESNGIAIDTTRLKSLINELYGRKQKLQEKAWRLVGRQFSLASVNEIRKIFLELGIVSKSLGKTWSTSKEMLNRLRMESNCHPLVATVLDWRSVQYAFTCVHQISRSLLSFSSQSGAVVRRYYPVTHLTSIGKINMKLQFVPKTKRLTNDDSTLLDGYSFSLREFFVASEGFVLLSADYSQLELRMMAHFSGDESLVESFNCDRDLFRELAAEFYKKQQDPAQVTDEERKVAKEVVYALNYGVGSKNLSIKINVSEADADRFRQKFTESYPRLHIYFKHLIDECRKKGYVTTLGGRRRYLPDVKHRDPEVRARAERQARNSAIAGSAADLVKAATLKIDDEMKSRGWCIARLPPTSLSSDGDCCFLIHQLHDELIYEVNSHLVNEAARIVRDCMTSCLPLKVKLAVKIRVGESWQNLKPYSIET